jgi:hypothetical protein
MLLIALALAEEPVQCPAGVEGCGPPPPVVGSLEKSAIDGVIKANMGSYRRCYQIGLASDPTIAGTVAVKFVIAKDGTVSSAVTKRTTLTVPAVESCLNSRFMGLVFPPPKGGGIVIVTYPFVFEPNNGLSRAVVRGRRIRGRDVAKALAPVQAAAIACSARTASRSVRFVVTAEGAIDELRLIGIPEPTESEQTCVRTAFASVQFARPGAPVPVYYSLVASH